MKIKMKLLNSREDKKIILHIVVLVVTMTFILAGAYYSIGPDTYVCEGEPAFKVYIFEMEDYPPCEEAREFFRENVNPCIIEPVYLDINENYEKHQQVAQHFDMPKVRQYDLPLIVIGESYYFGWKDHTNISLLFHFKQCLGGAINCSTEVIN